MKLLNELIKKTTVYKELYQEYCNKVKELEEEIRIYKLKNKKLEDQPEKGLGRIDALNFFPKKIKRLTNSALQKGCSKFFTTVLLPNIGRTFTKTEIVNNYYGMFGIYKEKLRKEDNFLKVLESLSKLAAKRKYIVSVAKIKNGCGIKLERAIEPHSYYSVLKDNLGCKFTKMSLVQEFMKFGEGRETIRKNFNEIIEIIKEIAAEDGCTLEVKRINNNSGTEYMLYKNPIGVNNVGTF